MISIDNKIIKLYSLSIGLQDYLSIMIILKLFLDYNHFTKQTRDYDLSDFNLLLEQSKDNLKKSKNNKIQCSYLKLIKIILNDPDFESNFKLVFRELFNNLEKNILLSINTNKYLILQFWYYYKKIFIQQNPNIDINNFLENI
jgi:hypothetical protein